MHASFKQLFLCKQQFRVVDALYIEINIDLTFKRIPWQLAGLNFDELSKNTWSIKWIYPKPQYVNKKNMHVSTNIQLNHHLQWLLFGSIYLDVECNTLFSIDCYPEFLDAIHQLLLASWFHVTSYKLLEFIP